MLIHNKDKRVHGFALSAKAAKEFKIDQVVLKPGINDVDQEHWDAVAGTKVAQHYVTTGVIVPKGGSPKARKSLSELDENEALDVVRATLDRELLAAFLDGEKRKPVLKAIKAQMDKVKVEGKKDEDSGAENEE